MNRQTRIWLFALLAAAVAALGPASWGIYLTLAGAGLLAVGLSRRDRGLAGAAALILLCVAAVAFTAAGIALARSDGLALEWLAAGCVFVGMLAFAALRRSPAASQGLLLIAVVGLFLIAAGPLASAWTLPALLAAVPVAFGAFFTRAGARPARPALVQTALVTAIAVPLFLVHPLLFEAMAQRVDDMEFDLVAPVESIDPGPIDLRDMRARKRDGTPRMIVHIEEGANHLWFPHGKPTLYLRGITYDTYRAGLWTSEFPLGPEQHLPTGYEKKKLEADTGAELRGMVIHVKDSFQPQIYFAPTELATIEGQWFRANAHGDLMIPKERFLLRRYRFSSRVPPSTAEVGLQEDAADPTPGYGELFGLEDVLRPIAEEWTAPYPSAPARVKAIVDRLRSTEFRYTSDPILIPGGVDPTLHFLTLSKAGECTDFASAAVLLLRAAGLQARLVAGYMSSEYDPNERNFRVTGRDAHAWVEVRFASHGWVTFDPTPPTTRFLDARTRAIPMPPVRPDDPVAGAPAWVEPIQSYRGEGLSGAWVGGGAIALLAVGAVATLLLRRRTIAVAERQRREGRAPAALLPFFGEFVKLMRRFGHGIGPTEPIERFAARLPSRYPREAVEAIVATYNRARFGGRPLAPDDDARAREALNALRRAAVSRG